MSTEDGDSGAVDDFVEPKASDDAPGEFTFEDELRDIFGQPQIRRTGGHWTANENELPTPIDDNVLEDAQAPEFTVENQVCIADLSAFVVRDEWGVELVRFDSKVVEGTPSGRFRVDKQRLVDELAAKSDGAPLPAVVKKKGAAGVAEWLCERGREDLVYRDKSAKYVEVEPVRPQCRHLVLQLVPPAPSQRHMLKQGWLHRYCAARRSMTGAFMGLSDDAMKACSLREPYDVESARLLKKFDADLLERSKNREYFPMFLAATDAAMAQASKET